LGPHHGPLTLLGRSQGVAWFGSPAASDPYMVAESSLDAANGDSHASFEWLRELTRNRNHQSARLAVASRSYGERRPRATKKKTRQRTVVAKRGITDAADYGPHYGPITGPAPGERRREKKLPTAGSTEYV
jgi:hypothetical protein